MGSCLRCVTGALAAARWLAGCNKSGIRDVPRKLDRLSRLLHRPPRELALVTLIRGLGGYGSLPAGTVIGT
jgi:hypothetical protein